MKNVFYRLPLPVKLLLVGIVPLLFVIYLSVQLFVEKTQNVALLQSLRARIDQSATLTRLIDALQRERAYSYDYALKKKYTDRNAGTTPAYRFADSRSAKQPGFFSKRFHRLHLFKQPVVHPPENRQRENGR